MGITAAEARAEIVDDLGGAIEQITFAVARLGEAYDALAVDSADRLEETLFRPAQKAFGRGKRALTQFAGQSGLTPPEFSPPQPGRRSEGAKGFVEQAVLASADADRRIAELQDSMLPIEFGDPDLRAGLAEVRELLAELPVASREFLRTLGR